MLSVEQLHCYYGQAHILHGLSFSVESGEVLALLGRNGAGKSTTLKGIAGLIKNRRGVVTLQSQHLERMDAHEIARLGMGYVPEERRIFSALTVMENLEVGRQARREDAPYWTPERLFELFPNLGRMKNRLGGQMSGGEQQMLSIARTLMGNPKLLLLDEPSEGLAPVIVEQMAEAIGSVQREGMTVVLCEQNLNFAALLAKRACVIEQGQLCYSGAIADLLTDAALRERYLGV